MSEYDEEYWDDDGHSDFPIPIDGSENASWLDAYEDVDSYFAIEQEVSVDYTGG